MNQFEHAVLLRDAAAVKRYHTVRTLRQQTLAEHSFGVAMLLRQVFPEARKELFLAVLHHDLPEFVTGDIPAPVKRQIPRLAVLLEEAEQGTAPLYEDFDLTAFEEAVLKWCDLMELVLWCLEELQLGNTYASHPCKKGLAWLADAHMVMTHPCTGATARALLEQVAEAAFKAGVPR